MSFPKGFLDELKARIRVSEVVGRRVKLVRKGREFVGLSPFTNEKTPSFTVNDDKQFYHCFSTGEHGDVIKFLEKVENLTFIEAVERLAAEAGLDMPERDAQSAERAREAASLVDISEMAAEFFRQKLQAGAGAEALAYLRRRGIKDETIECFGLGYAPDGKLELLNYLKARKVPVAQMIEAGLIIGGDDIPEPYDRFRNRVMFPIADPRGRIIAFGGRALDANAKAKYLNSPETPLFHKGRGLYNLHRARKPSYDAGHVVVVEGYMDVIGLAQGGFDNAVAPLGTALTEDQIQLLWRMAPEPILCFDGDKAGLRAAFRAVERVLPLLKPGHSLRFALLPEGKDPDDLVREEGADAMREVLAQARALSDMVWEKELSGGSWDTPERRAALEARIDEVVKSISDQKVRTHYAEALREKLGKLFGRGQGRAGPGQWRGSRPPFPSGRMRAGRFSGRGGEAPRFIPPASPELRRSALGRGVSHAAAREGLLVLTVLNHPELLDAHCEAFSEIEFHTPTLDRLRNEIIDIAALHAPLESETLKNHLLSRDLADIARSLEGAPAYKSDPFTRSGASPEEAEAGFLHTLARHRRSVTLEAELKLAERMLADEMTEENVARLRSIQAQLELLDRGEGATG